TSYATPSTVTVLKVLLKALPPLTKKPPGALLLNVLDPRPRSSNVETLSALADSGKQRMEAIKNHRVICIPSEKKHHGYPYLDMAATHRARAHALKQRSSLAAMVQTVIDQRVPPCRVARQGQTWIWLWHSVPFPWQAGFLAHGGRHMSSQLASCKPVTEGV